MFEFELELELELELESQLARFCPLQDVEPLNE